MSIGYQLIFFHELPTTGRKETTLVPVEGDVKRHETETSTETKYNINSMIGKPSVLSGEDSKDLRGPKTNRMKFS